MSMVAAPEQRRALRTKATLALEILTTYVRVRGLLRRDGLQPTLAALRAPLEGTPRRAEDRPLELGRAVRRALAPLPADTRCLSQSLVLTGLLARRGIETVLVLGVEDGDGTFGAHAWVEHEGRALLPPGSDPEKRLVQL
jgi:hypothetical protein